MTEITTPLETPAIQTEGAVSLHGMTRVQLQANLDAMDKDDAPAEVHPEFTPPVDPDLPPVEDENPADPEDQWKDEHVEEVDQELLDNRETWRKTRLNKEIAKREVLEAQISELRAIVEGRAPSPQPQHQPAPIPPANVVPGEDPLTAHIRQTVPEIRQLEARIQEINANPEKFATQQEWINALTDAKADRSALLSVHRSQAANQQQAQQRQQAQQVQERVTRWNTAVETSELPGVKAAAARLDARAGEIHPSILQAITDSQDPALATLALMSTPKTFEYFATESRKAAASGQLSPAVFVRLGELASAVKGSIGAKPIPGVPAATRQPASSTPPKGNVGSNSDAYWMKMADQDPVKYSKLVRLGKAPDLLGLKS
jgi:hypothetical protein